MRVFLGVTGASGAPYAARLLRALVASGYRVLAIAPADAYTEKLVALGVEHVDLPMDPHSLSPINGAGLTWDYLRILRRYRPDVYLKAAELLIAEGKAKREDFPFASDGYRPPQKEFIDGITFDGRAPNAYLKQFPIGLKDSQTVTAAGVVGG